MKSRVFTFISLLALVVAMVAAGSASAQTSPAQDVYNPNGQVLDVVEEGGNAPEEATPAPAPANEVEDDVESGQAPSVCSAADGKDANGNAVSYGSAADCATTTPTVASGSLPFTGFQAGLVALAGFGLLGAGFAMRRVARDRA